MPTRPSIKLRNRFRAQRAAIQRWYSKERESRFISRIRSLNHRFSSIMSSDSFLAIYRFPAPHQNRCLDRHLFRELHPPELISQVTPPTISPFWRGCILGRTHTIQESAGKSLAHGHRFIFLHAACLHAHDASSSSFFFSAFPSRPLLPSLACSSKRAGGRKNIFQPREHAISESFSFTMMSKFFLLFLSAASENNKWQKIKEIV